MLYELNGIEKVLGGRRILDIASLQLQPGLIYSLTGPNGAGKTTLLKLLAFLDRPNSGTMRFRSARVDYAEKDLLELRRQVVLVDQSPLLFTGSVAKNVEFGLRMRKIPSAERKKRVLEALQQVGMTGFIEAEAHKLSGGETKRVALARALAVGPQVLLCDEPTANVDSENQRIILDILMEINRNKKTSIIFSTHFLSQEQELAHHSLQLHNGLISETIAANLFKAELVERGERRSLARLENKLDISLPGDAAPEGSVLHLFIDQDKILFPEEVSGQRPGSLVAGRVMRMGEEGGRIRVDIDAGITLHFHLSHEAYRQRPLCLGEHITVLIPDDAVQCRAKSLDSVCK